MKIHNQEKLNRVIEQFNNLSQMVDSPQRRIATVIDMLLNEDGIITMDEMAFELNLGRTTLVNELKKHQWLSKRIILPSKENRTRGCT
ncbi:hypothetical protein AAHH67_24680 [Niallia circulans]